MCSDIASRLFRLILNRHVTSRKDNLHDIVLARLLLRTYDGIVAKHDLFLMVVVARADDARRG